MIPMARDAVPLYIYRRVETDDRGDVTEDWERTECRVLVSAYQLSSSRTQTEDGQVCQDQFKLIFALRDGTAVSSGDRLGDMVSAVWHLNEVKISQGHASCIGVRLRWRRTASMSTHPRSSTA